MGLNTEQIRLKTLIDNAAIKAYSHIPSSMDLDFYKQLYTLAFNEFPNVIAIGEDGYYLNPKVDHDSDFDDSAIEERDEYKEPNETDDDNYYTFHNVFVQQTLINLVDHFRDQAYIVRLSEQPLIVLDKCIIFYNTQYRDIYVLQDAEELREDIKNLVTDKSNNNLEDNVFFSYVTNNGQGFNETTLRIKRFETVLEDNYNDDLPDKEIKDFLKSTNSGLLLLHGMPGSGKTTYIRHLIRTLTGRHFIVLDQSVFNYITDATFIDLLIENRNAVIILEDCESMLVDRQAGNMQLASLLNLSDGIIGDSFNFKFICTFNANIAKIDKALLRRGRMRLKYEFKELTPDKVQKLAKKLGKEIPEETSLSLADVYNYGVDNGSKEERKVGFGK